MSTPDLPPPTSPIHGKAAEALGFPEGVQVVRLSNTGGLLGSTVGETWAAVTSPRNLLLGWAERPAGHGGSWRVVAEAAPGSHAPAAFFDEAPSRDKALRKLAELAGITAPFALAYEGPKGGQYTEEIAIEGRLYAYRPMNLAEATAVTGALAGLDLGEDTGAMVAEVIRALSDIMSPVSMRAMLERLRTAHDPLEYPAVVDALAEIVRRTQAAAEAAGRPDDGDGEPPAL